MTGPIPTVRPSGNVCGVSDCPVRFPVVGWFWDDADVVWRGGCIDHSTVIPPWRKGDWRYHMKVTRP